MVKAIKQGNKIHFISLGCPRNLVDSEVMLGILLRAGYEVAPEVPDADYLIVNTCGFLQSARDEAVETVRQLGEEKKPGARIIVAGCMVQLEKEDVKGLFPGVSHFLGSGDTEKILKLVQSEQEEEQEIGDARSYLEAGEVPRQISTPKHYAYLKIAEGCRKKCAYCIIPTIKGPLRSKSHEQIVKEMHALLNSGVKEIILIAQDLGDYGKDRGTGKQGLVELLQEMLKVEGDYWLRLLYLYPDEITDELIALIQRDKRICRYLDMPIQHVNNALLKSMRRKTSKEQITDTIQKLRHELPGIAIRTSLIVGFPGETDEQFDELADWLKHHPLENVGVFPYSREAGTPAAEMEEQIPEALKKKRHHQLMKVQQAHVLKHNKTMKGKKLRVLIEGYHPETNLLMVGRSESQCPDIDTQIIINDGRKVTQFGRFYEVQITDSADYDLIGKVIGVEEEASKAPPKASLAFAR